MAFRSKKNEKRRKAEYKPNPNIDLKAGKFARKVRRRNMKKQQVV